MRKQQGTTMEKRGRFIRANALAATCLCLASVAHGPLMRVTGAEAASAKPSSAASWIAADAALCIEVPRPDRVIDRLTDPRIQEYLGLVPQYHKLIDSAKFQELRSVVTVIAAQLNTTWAEG